ncbi:alpha/beta fold hydrolase [Microvirga pakistanensis]|uniref:alpha/beta fold hydrolase n=1 Tax=Microvirga pakistanensis TaxID=1682650 RepID=UPI00106C761D|nr:alpha/beta fold hydrolase [Microvirga pakistanensis]
MPTMTFDADGVALNYQVSGQGPNPLVCIHGVGSYLESWDRVVPMLEDEFRILRFDLRGHGQSARVKGRYEIDDFVQDTIRLADHLGFETFDLAGFSLGGLIAQRLALTHGARVRRLVLLSTVAGRTSEEKERVLQRLQALQTREAGSHYDASLSRWFTDAFQKANPALMEELRRRNAANDPDCYAAAYRVLAETDLGEELHRIACQTLIVTGEADQGSNPRMARLMHERIRGSRLTILPGMRHSILNEAADAVARLMREFLLEQDGSGKSRSGMEADAPGSV